MTIIEYSEFVAAESVRWLKDPAMSKTITLGKVRIETNIGNSDPILFEPPLFFSAWSHCRLSKGSRDVAGVGGVALLPDLCELRGGCETE